MVQKQKQIERNDGLDLDADGERKLEEQRAHAIVMEDLARKTYGEVQENTLEEEASYVVFEREAREYLRSPPLSLYCIPHLQQYRSNITTIPLEYYENLPRASRSNTGTKHFSLSVVWTLRPV